MHRGGNNIPWRRVSRRRFAFNTAASKIGCSARARSESVPSFNLPHRSRSTQATQLKPVPREMPAPIRQRGGSRVTRDRSLNGIVVRTAENGTTTRTTLATEGSAIPSFRKHGSTSATTIDDADEHDHGRRRVRGRFTARCLACARACACVSCCVSRVRACVCVCVCECVFLARVCGAREDERERERRLCVRACARARERVETNTARKDLAQALSCVMHVVAESD